MKCIHFVAIVYNFTRGYEFSDTDKTLCKIGISDIIVSNIFSNITRPEKATQREEWDATAFSPVVGQYRLIEKQSFNKALKK